MFSLGSSDGKESASLQETWIWSLGWENPLEKGRVTQSTILAWRIPWKEEHPWGLKKVGYDWATNTFTFYFHNISSGEYLREEMPSSNVIFVFLCIKKIVKLFLKMTVVFLSYQWCIKVLVALCPCYHLELLGFLAICITGIVYIIVMVMCISMVTQNRL